MCALHCRTVCAHHFAAESERYDADAIDMQSGSLSPGVTTACIDHCTQSRPSGLLPRRSALKSHKQNCKSAALAARSKRQLAVKATQESIVQVISPPPAPYFPPAPDSFGALRLHNDFAHAALVLLLQEVEQQTELPTRLNDIPHAREKRRWFYNEVSQAMKAALNDGQTRMKIRSVNHHLSCCMVAQNSTNTCTVSLTETCHIDSPI